MKYLNFLFLQKPRMILNRSKRLKNSVKIPKNEEITQKFKKIQKLLFWNSFLK